MFNKWIRIIRNIKVNDMKGKLTNTSFSLFCNNCIGGVLYHDLGMQFTTPTINLWIPNHDFALFVSDLHYYIECELIEEKQTNRIQYPIGKLQSKDFLHEDIAIHFMHYKSFCEAKEKWNERCKRVNWANIMIIVSTDYISDFDLEKINSAEVPTSILVHKSKSNSMKNVFKVYKKNPDKGRALKISRITGKRLYEKFNIISFLNQDY